MSRTPLTYHGHVLPDADQPPANPGSLSRVRLWWLCAQPAAALLHLCCDRDGHRTYCGAYHPDGVIDPGRQFSNGRLTVAALIRGVHSRRDGTRDRLGYRAAWNGRELSPCPDCLTLAAAESEMIAHPRIPVVRLTDQLAALPDDQDADQPQA